MQIDLGFKGIFEKIPDWREQGFMRANTLILTGVSTGVLFRMGRSRLSEPSKVSAPLCLTYSPVPGFRRN